MENKITYRYDSKCKACGDCKLTQNGTDFTLTAEGKERLGRDDTDHDCEYTIHEELTEPVTETVDY
jgi:hypothetical protein